MHTAQPVQVFQHQCSMFCLSRIVHQPSCGVDDSLELVQQVHWKASQNPVAEVQLHQDKAGDQWHDCMTRQRPLKHYSVVSLLVIVDKSTKSSRIYIDFKNFTVYLFVNGNFLCVQPKETSQQSRYNIQILIKETKKVGDGMNAYMTYKVVTKVCV